MARKAGRVGKRTRAIRGARPSRPKAGVVQRRSVAKAVRRGANIKRAKARTVRRRAVKRKLQTIAKTPHPVVRPAARPRRVMPRPTKAGIRAGVVPRPARRPVARGGQMAAAAAVAAGTFLTLSAAKAHPDISSDVSSLQYDLTDIQQSASFDEVEADIANLDNSLNHALSLLESARDKGYRYQADLEDIAYEAMSRWQEVRDQVLADIETQAGSFEGNLKSLDREVQRLNATLGDPNAATGLLRQVRDDADQLQSEIRAAESKVESVYSDIESKASQLNSRLTTIHWMLTQLEEASFELEKGEDLVRAVAARWDKEGKDDPEGVLFLSNQRLIFERKEKVATKKVLFVTTASELVQEVQFSHALDQIKKTKAKSKGLFGHQDFLDLEFSEGKPDKVSMHLNGQDSEEWARLIADAKSGKIEDDRATGKGLSFADLTGELTSADVVELQNEINELQDEMMLKDVGEELTEVENQVNGLKRQLEALRARGYAIEKSLEADVEVLAAQWERIKARAEVTLEHQTKLLGEQMTTIQGLMAALAGRTDDLTDARPQYVQIKSSIASAEAQAEAAEETVLAQYDAYADEIEALGAHFDWVDWMLDAISTASFQLLATESGVAAVEAIWARPGLDPENGVLFLTDQRLLWEDRVGDYELKLDVALPKLEKAKAETDEESGNQSLLVDLASGEPVAKATFLLALPVSESWLQMIGRARAGDYAKDRAVELDPAELERIRNAPEQCPKCGAALTAPILRGQTEITCEYCGAVVRI